MRRCAKALTVFAGGCGLQAELSALRLNRAGILTQLLGSEVGRWEVTAGELKQQLQLLTGDTFLCAASISYLGAFTGELRFEITTSRPRHQYMSALGSNNECMCSCYMGSNVHGLHAAAGHLCQACQQPMVVLQAPTARSWWRTGSSAAATCRWLCQRATACQSCWCRLWSCGTGPCRACLLTVSVSTMALLSPAHTAGHS